MEARNMDARDLVGLGLTPEDADRLIETPGAEVKIDAPFEALNLHPVPPLPPAPQNQVIIDPELPTTIEELRNLIRAEVLKVLSTVPRGEA